MNKDINSISILGTDYTISYVSQSEIDKMMNSNEFTGVCNEHNKEIFISTLDDYLSNEQRDLVMSLNLRHEIIHAFLNESGLSWDALGCNNWPKNEEMIGWLSIQIPKIFKVYKKLDIL